MKKKLNTYALQCENLVGVKHVKDDRANIGDNCVIRQALTEAHQAGRDEAVRKERLKWVNKKLVSQYIGIQWDGEKIIETYVDDIGDELQEDLPNLLEMITEKMSGKYSGSYSIIVVRSYQEGQMSHPDTGQWDFPPYYEIENFYYRRDDVYRSDYQALDDTIKALQNNK